MNSIDDSLVLGIKKQLNYKKLNDNASEEDLLIQKASSKLGSQIDQKRRSIRFVKQKED